MTPGQRAVACWPWRWMPGMDGLNDGDRLTVMETTEAGLPVVWVLERRGTLRIAQDEDWPEDATPDLSDPATLGGLLALVREAWGCDTLSVAHAVMIGGQGRWYIVAPLEMLRGPLADVSAATEVEALIAALEVAP